MTPKQYEARLKKTGYSVEYVATRIEDVSERTLYHWFSGRTKNPDMTPLGIWLDNIEKGRDVYVGKRIEYFIASSKKAIDRRK
jgi:hypothetical protein